MPSRGHSEPPSDPDHVLEILQKVAMFGYYDMEDPEQLKWKTDYLTIEQALAQLNEYIQQQRLDELKRIPIRSTPDPLDDTKVFWWHAYHPHELEQRAKELSQQLPQTEATTEVDKNAPERLQDGR